jgi:hypothetical protein
MSNEDEWNQADREQALRETRHQLEVIEREWKHWREQSKTLTIQLITLDGLSVLKAAGLSGHHRNTIKVWLDLHNAEQKAGQKK